MAYNAARNIVVSGSHDWTVRMHDADTGTPVPPVMVSGGPIQVISVSADGTRIATGGDEPRFRVWDAITGTVIRTIEAPHHILGQGNVGATGLALSADGETVVSSGNVEVRFWSVATGEMLREVRTFGGGPITISPDGETIATLAGNVLLWRASDGGFLRSLSMECSANTVAFSPGGALIAVGDGHGAFCGNSLSVFRVADGTLQYRVPTGAGNVSSVAFSPSGNFIATGSVPVYALNGEIAIWRAADGSLVNRFTNVGEGVLDIAFTSDDNHFAFGRHDAALTLATRLPLAQPIADVTVACGGEVPAIPPLIVGDGCDPSPSLSFTETTAPGVSGIDYTLTRTWTSTDACGNTATESQVVTVLSCNQSPDANCGGAIAVEATGPGGAFVVLNGSLSSDPDGDTLMYHWDVSDISVILSNPDSAITSGTFRIGVTMATLTVIDGRGGFSTCDVTITVEDTSPPEAMCTSDLAALWPPNHTMREVRLFITGTDLVSLPAGFVLLSITLRSDEPDDAVGLGDGATTGDVNGSDGFTAPVNVTPLFAFDPFAEAWVATIQLRAERAGNGDGRCYTIDATVADAYGNTTSSSCCIVVPHDQRR